VTTTARFQNHSLFLSLLCQNRKGP
jgi:hypothetical protein